MDEEKARVWGDAGLLPLDRTLKGSGQWACESPFRKAAADGKGVCQAAVSGFLERRGAGTVSAVSG